MRRIWYFGFRLESVICVCMKPVLSIVDYRQMYKGIVRMERLKSHSVIHLTFDKYILKFIVKLWLG